MAREEKGAIIYAKGNSQFQFSFYSGSLYATVISYEVR
jgi:hypothetical protein